MSLVIADGRCVAALLCTFDAERLRACLGALGSFAYGVQPWEAHGGAWKGLALVTNTGSSDSARASRPGDREPQETAALAAASYLRDALRAVPGRVVFARVMTLDPGGYVPPHRDPWHSLGTGLVRLQLVIDAGSDGGSERGLHLAGRDIDVRDGELWYTDVSQTHSVENASARPRVNVLIDVETTDAFVEAMGEQVCRDDVFVARRAHLTEAELRGFERDIVVPSAVRGLMGGEGPASIRIESGAPWLQFDGGPHVLLRAESRDVLNIVGVPPGLAIAYSQSGGAFAREASELQLVLRGGTYGYEVTPGHAFDLPSLLPNESPGKA